MSDAFEHPRARPVRGVRALLRQGVDAGGVARMKPVQKPHPPIWISGVVSPESVKWAAEHQYPCVALAPPLSTIAEIFDYYKAYKADREKGRHSLAAAAR